MPQVYAAADLMIARAGASTVAELAAVGVPAILVPWPGAADDHQTDNARSLAAVGAAVLLPESRAHAPTGWLDEIDAAPAPIRRRCRPWPPRPRAAGEIHRSGRAGRSSSKRWRPGAGLT